MRLNFSLTDGSIKFDKVTILTLEDPRTFSELTSSFYNYGPDGPLKLVFDDYKPLKENQVMVVSDVLSYNINTPSILKQVYADLEGQLNEKLEVKNELDLLAAKIAEIIAVECLENQLDLEYDEITVLELLKIMGVKLEEKTLSIYEKCYEIVQIYKYLSKKEILVFLNVGAYLTEEQFKKIVEYIELCGINALFVEPRKLYEFPQYILDSDYYLEKYE